MVSVRAVLALVLVALLVMSEAAPQFRGRPGRRFFGRPRPSRRFSRPNRFNNAVNQVGGFVRPFLNSGGGGSSQSQANAGVTTAQQGNTQLTNVNANVQTANQNRPGGFGVSGGLALASNLQFNSPFGNINLSNAQAQTVNRQQNLGGFFRG